MNVSKVVKTLTVDDLEQNLDKVFTEAQVLRQLDHPAIIRVTDCGYMDVAKRSQPFLVMDYFDGLTLEENVNKHGPLSPEDSVAIFVSVAGGREAAHAQNILHRDVKPANLLVRKEGPIWKVKIIDFGLALRQEAVRNTLTSMSSHSDTLFGSSIVGTLDYAAPEQMGKLHGVPVGPYSDVYGFGRTFCYALFQTTHPMPKHFRGLPEALIELLENCLEEKPDRRPTRFSVIRDCLGKLSPQLLPEPKELIPSSTLPQAEAAKQPQLELKTVLDQLLLEQGKKRPETLLAENERRKIEEQERRTEEENRKANETRKKENKNRELGEMLLRTIREQAKGACFLSHIPSKKLANAKQ